jgi:sulfur relay (sulfurtransferase) DsrC/TusE family protein|tara:strand:- start:1741 stop:2250 length:510 start_codon:yes stop_codon:yes gene_type:complete
LKKRVKKKKNTSKISVVSITIILVGITVFYFYSADQAKIRGFEFGNEIQLLQEEIQNEQGAFISSIAKWDENTISDDEMISMGENHLETFNNLLKKYDELQPPDSFSRSVKLLKLSLEYQIESHEHRLAWIKNGDDSEWIRSQELTQLSFEAEQVGLKSFNDAKTGIEQ